MKLKSQYFWFFIFGICTVAYQQVQDSILPNYIGKSSTIKYLLGVAPKFFPAIGIPVIIVSFFKKGCHNGQRSFL